MISDEDTEQGRLLDITRRELSDTRKVCDTQRAKLDKLHSDLARQTLESEHERMRLQKIQSELAERELALSRRPDPASIAADRLQKLQKAYDQKAQSSQKKLTSFNRKIADLTLENQRMHEMLTSNNRKRAKRTARSQSPVRNNTSSVPLYHVGDRVMLTKHRRGMIRWRGHIGSISLTKSCYGIELEQPQGGSDGRFGGKQYFRCRPKYGTFVSEGDVIQRLRNNGNVSTSNPSSSSSSFHITDFRLKRAAAAAGIPISSASNRPPATMRRMGASRAPTHVRSRSHGLPITPPRRSPTAHQRSSTKRYYPESSRDRKEMNDLTSAVDKLLAGLNSGDRRSARKGGGASSYRHVGSSPAKHTRYKSFDAVTSRYRSPSAPTRMQQPPRSIYSNLGAPPTSTFSLPSWLTR